MALIYDHLTSLIIAGTVVLIIGGVQLRGQSVSVERTMMYTAKADILVLADVLERDLSNAGVGGGPGDTIIETESQNSINGPNFAGVTFTDELVFYGRGSSGTRTKIRYVVEKKGEKRLGGTTDAAMLQWRRDEWRSGRWQNTGRSAPTLTDFDISFLNASGSKTTPDQAQSIEVSVVNSVGPGAGDDFLKGQRHLHWRITLRPASFDRR